MIIKEKLQLRNPGAEKDLIIVTVAPINWVKLAPGGYDN
jgi:hypothetical protein